MVSINISIAWSKAPSSTFPTTSRCIDPQPIRGTTYPSKHPTLQPEDKPSRYPVPSIHLFQTHHENAAPPHSITSILVYPHIGYPARGRASSAETSTSSVLGCLAKQPFVDPLALGIHTPSQGPDTSCCTTSELILIGECIGRDCGYGVLGPINYRFYLKNTT